MANLETSFVGLKLKNPVIVSSSGLTDSVEKIKKIEEYGAGAVVLKSLFEEQIEFEAGSLLFEGQSTYPEAEDYVRGYVKNNSVDEYLDLIEKAKKETKIPIIASINCVSNSDWVTFSKKIEKAGADALELNINVIPTDPSVSSADYENTYYEIFEQVKKQVEIPIIVKIGAHFTNLLNVVSQLQFRGANAVTIFNRFYEPDIDIKEMKMTSAEVFSSPADIRSSLRWIGIMSDKIEGIQIAASTGTHDGNAVVKQLLAGASTVQVCSTLYKNGVKQLATIIKDIDKWMSDNKFNKIDDFKGILSYSKLGNPRVYERSQFMKYFSSTN